MQRYGKKVKHWSFWNEPGNPWMYAEHPEAPAFNRMEQLVRKVIKPGRDAALAANPAVVIVGPDDNDPGNLHGILNLEAAGTHGRLFDIISIHAYNEAGSSTGTKLNQFKSVLDLFQRREVWLTETQSSQDSIASNLEEFFMRGWVSKIFLYTMRDNAPCGFNTFLMLDYAKNPCYGHSLLAFHMSDQGQPAVHFAGTTGGSGHNDFVLLQNPHNHTAGVNVRFSKNGAGPITQFYSLAPHSRATVHVGSAGHANADQGVSIFPTTASLPIFAEHADYWHGGDAGRLSQGSGERSDKWYFAEGAFAGGYFLHENTVYNPNPHFSVTVTWRFLNASGSTVSHVKSVPTVPNALPVAVVVERSMYLGAGWTIGTKTEGATSASQRWLLPEGSTEGDNYHAPFFLLANPSTTAATVQLQFQLPGGGAPFIPPSITVPALGRVVVNPWNYPQLQNTTFSTEVIVLDSSPPSPVAPGIIVERSTYWGGALGGHSGLGIY